jgi:hypothetical protein
VISNQDRPDLEWEDSLQNSVGICYTAAKAYEISLFLAGITRPDKNYRKCVQLLNLKGAVTVSQIDGEGSATIVKAKIYKNFN